MFADTSRANVVRIRRSRKSKAMQRHVILTRGRSGSNHLSNTLNLHPEIVNFGEVFGDWTLVYKLYRRWCGLRRTSINELLEFVYGSRVFYDLGQLYSLVEHIKKRKKVNFKPWHRVKSVGIKDFIHIAQERGALEFFTTNEDMVIIHLYRRNILRRYLSAKFVDHTGVALSEKGAPAKRGKLVVDREDMLERLATFAGFLEEESALLGGLPNHRVKSICFEDYFANPEATAGFHREVFEFLGVQPIEQGSRQQKMSPKHIADMVENFDEMRQWLGGTPYEQYLD